MQNFHQNYNVFEAWFWFVFAFVMPVLFSNYLSVSERVMLFITAFVFSLSDLIEVQTGAWWRPWWLLVIKGACLVSLVTLCRNLWRSVHQVKDDPTGSDWKE